MQTALVFLALIGGFLLFLKLIEKRMIYYPSRDTFWTPREDKLPFDDLRLQCADAAAIHGWFIPAAQNPRATILFFHGNAGNISHRVDKILLLHGFGLDVCIVDYHGYGQSEGKPSERTTYLDADAAYEWLTKERRVPPEKIILWGESLGGGIATYLAAKQPVGGLVLESTYTTLPDVGQSAFPFLPVKLIMSTKYDSLGRIRTIRVPVLSIHSPHDEVIPYRLGKKLFDAANEPKQFVELAGDHNGGFLLSEEEFRGGIREYLDEHFPGAGKQTGKNDAGRDPKARGAE